jgi:hypothetical protein
MSNPHCADTYASLIFLGEALVPEDISRALGVQPSKTAFKGEVFVSPSGKTRTAQTGRWLFESSGHVHSSETEDHVNWLLDVVDRAGVTAASLPGVEVAWVSCYWVSAYGHGGPAFSPRVLGRLAHHGIILSLDFYSAVGDDEGGEHAPEAEAPAGP